MLAPSPRSMLSPRFLLLPALALGVIAALGHGKPATQSMDAAVRAPAAVCAQPGSAQPKPDPACRLARDDNGRALLR